MVSLMLLHISGLFALMLLHIPGVVALVLLCTPGVVALVLRHTLSLPVTLAVRRVLSLRRGGKRQPGKGKADRTFQRCTHVESPGEGLHFPLDVHVNVA